MYKLSIGVLNSWILLKDCYCTSSYMAWNVEGKWEKTSRTDVQALAAATIYSIKSTTHMTELLKHQWWNNPQARIVVTSSPGLFKFKWIKIKEHVKFSSPGTLMFNSHMRLVATLLDSEDLRHVHDSRKLYWTEAGSKWEASKGFTWEMIVGDAEPQTPP
jgi:hypothetical protein